MTRYDIKRLALVFAVQAKIEGMKAQNKIDDMNGNYPSWSFSDFDDCSEELKSLAYAPDEEV